MANVSYFFDLIDRASNTGGNKALPWAMLQIGPSHLKVLVCEMDETPGRGQAYLDRYEQLHTWLKQSRGCEHADRAVVLQLLNLFRFDRDLRAMLSEGLKSIETLLRSRICHALLSKLGSSWLQSKGLYTPNKKLTREINDVDRLFGSTIGIRGATHNISQQRTWFVLSRFSFWELVTFYKVLHDDLRKDIASTWGCTAWTLQEWLESLHKLRNLIAHHNHLVTARHQKDEGEGRNRKKYSDWVKPPKVPSQQKEKNPNIHLLYQAENNKEIFTLVAIVCFMRKPFSTLPSLRRRVKILLKSNPIFLPLIGAPAGWQTNPAFSDL